MIAGGPDAGGGAGGQAVVDPRLDVNLIWPSSGCGKPLPEDQVITVEGEREGYTQFTVLQTGETLGDDQPGKAVEREIYVRVPADYQPNTVYPVVYLAVGCGAASGDVGSYALFDESQGGNEQAIYVALSLPPNAPNGPCYDTRSGENSQEWEAFELFHSLVESTYCADNNRVFVSGFGSGLVSMWACYFSGLPDPPRRFAPNFRIRGEASTSAVQPDDIGQWCDAAVDPRPVAGLWLNDEGDPVSEEQAERARDRVLANNGCLSSATAPWPFAPHEQTCVSEADAGCPVVPVAEQLSQVCERYVDCPAEYPVIYCNTEGQSRSDRSPLAIYGYTEFFKLMDPQ